MARSDALEYLHRYAGDRGEPLTIPTFADDADDDEYDVADDDEGDEESDDEAAPGDEDEDEDEAGEPGPSLSDRIEGVIGSVIPGTVVDRVKRLPTPAGLFGVFAALILLTVILVPANTTGQTRLELIWRAMTGGVSLPPTDRAAAAPQSDTIQTVEQAAQADWNSFWGGVSSLAG